ncbi:ankyrin repeat-containing domain protein [Ilyonectria sp. MPI-CAGE-AT-0026]|nr:ankyrin repeat-containing domain protein [Ilyonectria sp. MPI-CAGE-AT-0026]
MVVLLPEEIICMITKQCSLKGQASLARSCVQLHAICNYILYRNDVQNHGCSSVFHAIAWCHDQALALRTLAAAEAGGADFRQCHDARNHHPLSFHHSDTTLHSPIHLAARRGLDDIISFLVSHGIPPDGPEGVCRTPLAEAILHNQESTAILLVHQGASVGLQPPEFDAYRAAVRQGLAELTKIIVKAKDINVNSEDGYGCTALMLAVCHRRRRVVRVLLDLGADAKAALRDFCQNHTFASLLWTLEAGSSALRKSLGLKGLLDLVVSVAVEQVSPIQKSQQVTALQTLLELLQRARSGASSGPVLPTDELDCFLDALLQRVLSVERADAAIASMLLQHGARIRVGIFLQLLGILNSTVFAKDNLRCLRRHPRLLQSFDFVYSYCANLPAAGRSFTVEYFIENVPDQAVRLVYELKRLDLPLTARGVQRMSLRAAGEGTREAQSGTTA